jgi:hypothetical protein
MWTIGDRRTRPGTVLLAMALMFPWATPAVADPPERIEEVAIDAFPDLENRLAVFVNTTREDLCDWLESGAEGPPPGSVPISIQIKETQKGAVVVSGRGVVPIELWRWTRTFHRSSARVRTPTIRQDRWRQAPPASASPTTTLTSA